MGSGCNSSCGDLFEKRTPDTQVKYTGPAIPSLGICTNDTLDEIEAVILQKILDFSTGKGINIPDIDLTTCEAFIDCITCCDNCTDLPCLLECYKNAICRLWDLVKEALDGPYNVRCLTGVNSNSKLKAIVQALIDAHCALAAKVATLETALNNLTNTVNNLITNLPGTIGNFLLNHISSCQGNGVVIKTGSGANAQIAFKGFVPVGGFIPYAGTINGKFDAAGNGITGTDMCGWRLCNGEGGAIDMRELVPMGAGQGVMGGGNLASNTSGDNYPVNALVGKARHKLTGDESGLQQHNHQFSMGKHSHRFRFHARSGIDTSNPGPNLQRYWSFMSFNGSDDEIGYSYENPKGIDADGHPQQSWAYVAEDFGASSNPSGGQTLAEVKFEGPRDAKVEHENRQPSRAVLFIQRMS